MPRLTRSLAFVVSLPMLATFATAADPPAQVSFTREIAPLFVENCYACHNAKAKKGKYDMSTFEALMKGGGKGDSVKPGNPDESLLLLLMLGIEQPSMPKEADLLDEKVVARVELWIKQGAKFDGPSPTTDLRELVGAKAMKSATRDYKVPTPTTALAIRPDGKELAVASYYEITFWNPADGKLLRRLPTESQRIHALEYSGDGKRLLHAGGTPGEFGEVALWNAESLKLERQLLKTTEVMFAATFNPDGKQLAAGGTDRIFRIWETDTGKELHKVENHADWVTSLAFSPDGKRILSSSRDKSVKIWDQTTREPVLTFPGHTDGVYGVGISADAKFGASVGADKTLRFWETAGEAKQLRTANAHTAVGYDLVFPKSGKLVFTCGADKLLKAWSPADAKEVRSFAGHTDWVYSIALSADEKQVASGAWNGEVRVWEVDTGKLITQFVAVPSLTVASAAQAAPPAGK